MADVKKSLVRQLNILKGQIEGIRKLIEEDQDCMKIIIQMKAVKSGLNKVGREIISEKFQECLISKKKKLSKKELESLLETLGKY